MCWKVFFAVREWGGNEYFSRRLVEGSKGDVVSPPIWGKRKFDATFFVFSQYIF